MASPERWMVISNCQTYGLAHSLQMLADGITVEPVDAGQYQAHLEHYAARFQDYDRLLVSAAAEGVPGADFSSARRVDKLPELPFSAYHPDMTYVMAGAAVVNGPIAAYQSMIAFVAHGRGLSVAETLALYNRHVYAACGYLDGWAAARDGLIGYCRHFGLDVSHAVRRWAREGAFMYSGNHPRIRVLYDLARLYLEREGYAARVSDVLPQDNLAASNVFPVYPEIGEVMGAPGSYLFKRAHEYSQIGLRQFVEESFAAYDGHPPGTLATHAPCREKFARVSAAIDGARLAA